MRPGIVPALLCSIAILLGLWLFDTEWFFAVRLVVAILAAILVVMCFQARKPLNIGFAVFFIAVVILWNPLVDLTAGFRSLPPAVWLMTEVVIAAATLWGGIVIRVPLPKGGR